MSDRPAKHEQAAEDAAEGASASRFGFLSPLRLIHGLRAWASGHWIRGVIMAVTILSLIAFTVAGWAYLANVALRSGELTVDGALAELDKGNYDKARTAVGRMLKTGLLARREYGGPLFVLGVAKIKDAEEQGAPARRRVDYLVASRYFKEARAHHLPEARANEALFLLGKSLIESGQVDEGVESLEELVAKKLPTSEPMSREALHLLANTCRLMPTPENERAVECYDTLLSEPSLEPEERAQSTIDRCECLIRLDKYEDASKSLAEVPADFHPAEVALVRGKVLLYQKNHALKAVSDADRPQAVEAATAQLTEAKKCFESAASLDEEKGPVTRQARYQFSLACELLGDRENALVQYSRTRQLYGDSLEGLAAALGEADMIRQSGDGENIVAAYRRVLEGYADVPIYTSVVMTVPEIRTRMTAALKELVERKRFSDALTLVNNFPPLFTQAEQLEFRAGTFEQWGNFLLSQASPEAEADSATRSAGWEKLREAGLAYEKLAELRYATRFYTADLWNSADMFYQGHNFTRSINLLERYLDNEPELRNPQALLRLGQSHLALGHVPEAIAAFEECIEFHPVDGYSFQARIDCAKAHWHRGEMEEAERLLRDNLAGTSLKPSSREWKDSLFELGLLLHETGRHEEAIGTLEEAVERYQSDPQRLLAKYVIGESYRQVAQKLLERASLIRTGSEREKNLLTAKQQLTTALGHFEDVQRAITLKTHDFHRDPLMGTMLRNCYMLQGSVLFDLGCCDSETPERHYREAIEAYSNVASLYPDNPFVLETFVQIANCWRRLGRSDNARGAIHQAQIVLDRLPADSDFNTTTTRNRDEWKMLLADMSKW